MTGVAIILSSVQMIPQLIKSLKTKKVRDVSLWMSVVIALGAVCWLSYGIDINDKPIIIANALNFVFASVLFYMKKRY